jgi:hypothetical protein
MSSAMSLRAAPRREIHPRLSLVERFRGGFRRDRSHRGHAVHAEIRSGRHQRRNRAFLHRGRKRRQAVDPGPLPERRDVRRYFQLFICAWAAYFLLKAALYFVLGATLPLTTELALRSAIGGIVLGWWSPAAPRSAGAAFSW